MKIRYKYQPSPADTCHYGVDFIGGVAEVTDTDLIAKFAVHPHFELAEAAVDAQDAEQDDRAVLAAEYEAAFGRKPHHKMKAETIREALADANDE